jgi:hypothetical protein
LDSVIVATIAMSITLDLPPELEKKLAAEASRQGVPLSDYLLRVLSNGGQAAPSFRTGAELVAYWQQAGVVGSRADIGDSQQHARELRAEAERRERP